MNTVQSARQKLFSRLEACDYLRIGPTTLWRITVKGLLPSVRIGSRVLYRQDDLDSFVKHHRRTVRIS